MLEHTYKHTYIHFYMYRIYIVICVPSLVEIAPGVPGLCWNIHIHKHTDIHLYIYIYIYIYSHDHKNVSMEEFSFCSIIRLDIIIYTYIIKAAALSEMTFDLLRFLS
jgi:hypothetical protein